MRVSILIVALILFGFTAAMAILPAGGGSKYGDAENKTAFVFAVGYQDAMQIDAGLAIPIAANLYTFVSAMGGDYGFGLGGRLSYILRIGEADLWIGLAAGPEAEWHNIPDDGQGPMAYVTGATGMMIGYSFEGWGLFGLFERNFPLEQTEKIDVDYTAYGAVYIDL